MVGLREENNKRSLCEVHRDDKKDVIAERGEDRFGIKSVNIKLIEN